MPRSRRNLGPPQIEQSLLGHERGCGISGLAVTSLGLWSASFDCRVRLWSEGGACLAVLIGHTHPVRCLAADRGRLVSGDYRGFVMIWDAEDVVRELDTSARKRHSAPSGRGTGSGIYRLEGRQVVMSGGETCEVGYRVVQCAPNLEPDFIISVLQFGHKRKLIFIIFGKCVY